MNLMVTQDNDLDRFGLLGSVIPYILFGVDLYCLVFEMWSRRGRGRRGWCGMMCCRWILWVPPRLLYIVQEPWVTSKGLDLIGLFTWKQVGYDL